MPPKHVFTLRLFYLALITSTLTGCETMSKGECLSADWFQVGYQAGREGGERSHIEDIVKSCAKTNVIPDREAYFSGRSEGLREYCTPQHGFELGKNGTRFNNVCPPETVNRFEYFYQQGYQIFDARQQVKRLESKRHNLERQLEKASTDKGKKDIRDDLAELDKRLRYARDALRLVEDATYRF